jgi:hypothetical protein
LRATPLEAIWQAACHAAAETACPEATTVAAHAATSAAPTHASILQGANTRGGDQSEVTKCNNTSAVHSQAKNKGRVVHRPGCKAVILWNKKALAALGAHGACPPGAHSSKMMSLSQNTK